MVLTTEREELLTWNGNGWSIFPGRGTLTDVLYASLCAHALLLGRWFGHSDKYTFALGSDASIWRYYREARQLGRPARKVDDETEDTETEAAAESIEENIIV